MLSGAINPQPSLGFSCILDGLNPEQKDAVTLPVDAGPVMVLAGAGTGKTSVLTKRIAYLCANGIDPSAILAVTFTNKAAKEMKERLKKLHVHPVPLIGTFHSIGLKILKHCPEAAGVANGVTVMDDDESKRLWKSLFLVADNVKIGAGEVKMRKSDPDAKIFMAMMFAAKENGVRLNSRSIPNQEKVSLSVSQMLGIYEAERKAQNRVDFSDLISASLEAITKHESGIRWASGFSHILVDEFQDTSVLQFEWATSISKVFKTEQQIFCVGDDNQSIYSFRGAHIGNIEQFVTEFGATEILLEQNYRCGSEILSAANKLISKNPNGSRKKLWTNNHAGQIDLSEFQTDKEESESIARSLIDSESNLKESAILVRTRGAMIPITKALRGAGVDHHVVGAMDFFDSKEIRDALALCRFAVNNQDFISFTRGASLFDKIGAKTVEGIIADAIEYRMDLLDICSLNKKLRVISYAFDGIDTDSPASESLEKLVKISGLLAECEKSEEEHRLVNLRDLVEISKQFGGLGEFVEEITLFADKENQKNGVTVSTIHAAKGLEWSRVYLPVLNDGHLPMNIKNDNEPHNFAIEEERRLLYVAITRAKKELYLSFPLARVVHGSYITSQPSEFLKEAGLLRIS